MYGEKCFWFPLFQNFILQFHMAGFPDHLQNHFAYDPPQTFHGDFVWYCTKLTINYTKLILRRKKNYSVFWILSSYLFVLCALGKNDTFYDITNFNNCYDHINCIYMNHIYYVFLYPLTTWIKWHIFFKTFTTWYFSITFSKIIILISKLLVDSRGIVSVILWHYYH